MVRSGCSSKKSCLTRISLDREKARHPVGESLVQMKRCDFVAVIIPEIEQALNQVVVLS